MALSTLEGSGCCRLWILQHARLASLKTCAGSAGLTAHRSSVQTGGTASAAVRSDWGVELVQAAETQVQEQLTAIKLRGCKEEFVPNPALLQNGQVLFDAWATGKASVGHLPLSTLLSGKHSWRSRNAVWASVTGL